VAQPRKTENKPKRELAPGQSEALLRELHLITRDNKLHADSLRKLKQVNHLARLIAPALEDVIARHPKAQILDAGAGNAYLGFVLYELFLKQNEAELWSVEPRADLVANGVARAKKLGFTRMHFVGETLEQAASPKMSSPKMSPEMSQTIFEATPGTSQTISEPSSLEKSQTISELAGKDALPERLHLVTALHACDTATDDAMLLALKRKADHIALVPCCQAEVAAQLKDRSAEAHRTHALEPASPWNALWQHPIHRREFGTQLTNALRALVLEAHGYQVTVTELTGWEHSLKNELILARRVGGEHRGAKQKLRELLEATGVRPKIVQALGLIPEAQDSRQAAAE
jgi:hypothetical protein